MIPTSSIYLAFALLLSIGYGGYEHFSYKQYRSDIEAMGKAQQIAVDATKKQQELATKGVEDAYKSKIDSIRAAYSGLHDSRGSPMSTIPNTTIRIDDPTAIMVLAEQCTQTTQQLTSLQEWINLQIGISK